MKDPYQVLGVSRDATDEQISKAYKKLAKKYHPDLNPGSAQAEEKMREINAAYDAIRSGNASGYNNTYNSGTGYGYGYGNGYGNAYGNYYGGEQYQNDGFEKIREMIKNGKNQAALDELERMNTRSGQWYYLCAVAHYNLGNNSAAMSYAAMAVQHEPNNMQFRQFYAHVSSGGAQYGARRASYGENMQIARCSRWLSLLLCMMFGGRCFVPFFCCY